ncbi:MAG: hypothetical protein AB7E79_09520 [Rhodospirillaceae bacterium]
MKHRDSRRDRFRGDAELNEQRYGSEAGPRGRSKFSPRGNDQDWGDECMYAPRGPQRTREWQRTEEKFSVRDHEQQDFEDRNQEPSRRRPYDRDSYDRDPPANFDGDMDDFGTTRRAQFGHGDYYGTGEHTARKIGMHGRGRDQYFASDDDRDWDRGQIVRAPSTRRPRDDGERSAPARWRTSRQDKW